jgi:hypothetical protein
VVEDLRPVEKVFAAPLGVLNDDQSGLRLARFALLLPSRSDFVSEKQPSDDDRDR